MRTSDFDYHLPEDLIAQRPLPERAASRMLVLGRDDGACEVRRFPDLCEYLRSGDCLIFNDTRVIPARLFGVKMGGGASIEAMLLEPESDFRRWCALLRPMKRLRPGAEIALLNRNGDLDGSSFRIFERLEEGALIEFSDSDIDGILERCGHIPLPPYIHREDELTDVDRYQTVYARVAGAVAAPTAGLHFTPEILSELSARGIRSAALTLHVGAGTFRPVSVEDPSEHHMHRESYDLPEATVDLVNRTHRDGGRVLAVGTTTVRVLESCADADGVLRACRGSTDIFLYPPYRPRVVDMLLTNFHLPRSTLLMLVCCFAERSHVLNAYELAVRERFRFYSYGDCMLLC